MSPAPPELPRPGGVGVASPTPVAERVRFARLRSSPLARRVTGYSAGSIIAACTSEAAFAAAFGWLHASTTLASLAGFVGGAIPNYVLNRRWAWSGRNGRSRRDEIVLYFAVALASFAASAVVTHYAERWARHLTGDQGLQVVLVAAAFLAVSAVFFAGKFVVYELLVFTEAPATVPEPAAVPAAADPPVVPAPVTGEAPSPLWEAPGGGDGEGLPPADDPPPAAGAEEGGRCGLS